MHRLRLYGVFIGLMICVMLICDALAFKVVVIKGHSFAASGLIFSLSFLLASVATEVYGYKLAGRIVWIQMLCQAVFILFVNFFVFLPSPEGSKVSELYLNLYSQLWHVLFASSISVPIAYFTNDFVLSRLKIYMMGKLFFLRIIIANSIANAVLVSISYPINLSAQYDLNYIANIAFNTWLYKMVATILIFPIALILASYVKKIEKIDFYDYGKSYNPLLVFSSNLEGENRYELRVSEH